MDNPEELKELLLTSEKPLEVIFTKADGTDRTMICSRNAAYLPPAPKEAKEKKRATGLKVDPNIIVVFDIEKQAWRSFNFTTLKSQRVLNDFKPN